MKPKLAELKKEIDKSTIIFGNFDTSLSTMNEITRQKNNEEIEDINTVNPLDQTDISRINHQ